MKKSRNKDIINSYEPLEGFYDLKNFVMSDNEFIKFYNVQKFLFACEAARKKGAYHHNKLELDRIKEFSASYQQTLLAYPLKNK